MEIKATDVKRLREKTGAGMLDCKNALVKTDGDFDKAERLLKEQGLAAAVKKSDRVTNSGQDLLPDPARQGHPARAHLRDRLRGAQRHVPGAGDELLDDVAAKNLNGPTDELHLMVKETIGKIKENMQLRRIVAPEVRGQRGPRGIHPRRPHRGHAALHARRPEGQGQSRA